MVHTKPSRSNGSRCPARSGCQPYNNQPTTTPDSATPSETNAETSACVSKTGTALISFKMSPWTPYTPPAPTKLKKALIPGAFQKPIKVAKIARMTSGTHITGGDSCACSYACWSRG